MHSFRRLYRWLWCFRTTPEGKALAWCLIVSSSVAMASLEIPAYRLMFALFGTACVASAASVVLRPSVRMAGRFPERAVAEQRVTGEFTLTNVSKRAAYDLSVGLFDLPHGVARADSEAAIFSLAPGESAAVPLTLLPKRRGLYSLPDARPYTTFPLNLLRTRAKVNGSLRPGHGSSLLVLPSFHPITGIDVPIGARYQPGGIALSSNIGESPEYIGNREYRAGDPARRIDHRSWARLAMPVVREYQEEYYCRIALVLDTFVPGRRRPGAGGFPQLEAAVSLSASVADAMSRGEYIIDVFAAGPELYVFRAGRHTAHFENVLEILACVDACRTNPFEKVTPALTDELANISTVIAVFLDWDEARADLVRGAVESGCSVKVLIVRGEDTTEPYTDLEGVRGVMQLAPEDIQKGGIETL